MIEKLFENRIKCYNKVFIYNWMSLKQVGKTDDCSRQIFVTIYTFQFFGSMSANSDPE